MTEYEQARKKRRLRGRLLLAGLLLLVLSALACALYIVATRFKVSSIYVEGNRHYTDEEIIRYVMDGPLGKNSLYLSLKYKNKGVTGVPFVETMDVSILTPTSIKISVYEKSIAGFVQYLDNYMYFDKDGIVVECSYDKTPGIPQVSGLSFDHVVLYEPLPVGNEEIFNRILDMTQLLGKYELTADKLHFSSDYEMSLYFGNVRVLLGDESEIDEKLMLLQTILPELTDKKGRLDLSEYDENNKSVTFEPE